MDPFTIPGPPSTTKNPVIELKPFGVKPISPLIVFVPVLVIAARAKISKPVPAPRFIAPGERPVVVPVVKFHGFGTAPDASALPSRSLAPVVIVAVYVELIARALLGVNVPIQFVAS